MDPNMSEKEYKKEIHKMVIALQKLENGAHITAGELAHMAGAVTTAGYNIFDDLDTYGLLDDFLEEAENAGYEIDDTENNDEITGLARTYGFKVYKPK